MVRFLHLGVLLLGLFHSSSLWAEDSQALLQKDVFFEPGGGVRARYFNLRAGTGGSLEETEDQAAILHRFQVDLLMHKGEFFQTFARLIHVDQWGRQSAVPGDSSNAIRDSFTRSNVLYVNQAWGLWKVNESLGIRFGRSPIVVGSGRTYGENQWFDLPYAFDNVKVFWDWEYVKLGLIGAKVQELSRVSGQTLTGDPEENHFILDVDIRNTADWIQLLNFHFVQVNRDVGSGDLGATALAGLNMQRLGLDFAFQSRQFTGEVYFSYINGEQKINNVEGTLRQSVADVKLNYNVPDWSNMNFYATGHVDSGDDNPNDTESRRFDGFYYDVYGRSGRMEFLRWGNLFSYSAGFSLEATSSLTLGAEFWKFEKTKAQDSLAFGQAGRLFQAAEAAGDFTFSNDSEIGSELDIYLDFKFPSQVELSLNYGAFLPGATFKNATSTSGRSARSYIEQWLVEVSLFF